MLLKKYITWIIVFNIFNFSCSKKTDESTKNYNSIVIIGSSSAKGTGATNYSKSWAGLLNSSMSSSKFTNLSESGYTTYQVLPYHGSNKIDGRPPVDTLRNIDRAISLKPDLIIISLPSNDAQKGYTIDEIMSNLKDVIDVIEANDIQYIITTSMPRDRLSVKNQNTLLLQRDMTLSKYVDKSVNIYDPLALSTNYFNPDLYISDHIHPNDKGHEIIYSIIFEKIKTYIHN